MKTPILIVTSDSKRSSLLESSLKYEGTSIKQAESISKASEYLETADDAIVILDDVIDSTTSLDFIESESKKHPSVTFVVLSRTASIDGAVKAITSGAVDYLPSPVDIDALTIIIKRIINSKEVKQELELLRGRLNEIYGFDKIIAISPVMESVFKKVKSVAKTDSNVLIEGETGVGKELVAHAIHTNSDRPEGRFVVINCASLPETLLESELFGHEKGAFTGAEKLKLGKFEFADGGTIFLDEVGETSKAMQVKLLRIIQEKQFERVGGHDTITVDVRIIAATNMTLKKLVDEGSFRQDLYYRLNVFPIEIPSLRERLEDIPILAAHFLKKYRAEMGKNITGISEEVIEAFRYYPWLGNVRELENLIERAVIIEESGTLQPQSFPIILMAVKPLVEDYDIESDIEQARKKVIDIFEREYLDRLLSRYKGKIKEVADHAKLSPRSIHNKMTDLKLRKEDYK
ncbi:MAG: sigma 54-interacting transcriptional regulator [Planctomycetota bacterium]|jgi:DNA-binding NtrC family response regulator